MAAIPPSNTTVSRAHSPTHGDGQQTPAAAASGIPGNGTTLPSSSDLRVDNDRLRIMRPRQNLLKLPIELLDIMSKNLSMRDVRRFRQVNRYTNEIVSQQIKHVVVRHPDHLAEALSAYSRGGIDKLTLEGDDFTDVSLTGLPNLDVKHLDLSKCFNITNTGLGHLHNKFPNLKGLNLSNFGLLNGIGLGHLQNLRLEELNLSDNANLTDADFSQLNLPHLKKLDVSKCPGFGPLGFAQLHNMPLEELNLSRNAQLTDADFSQLNLPGLKKLDLSSCPGFGPLGFAQLHNMPLEELNLCLASLTDADFAQINLPHLKELDVSYCGGFGPRGLDQLHHMPLEALNLSGSHLTDDDFKQLSLPGLKKLDVSYGKFGPLGLEHLQEMTQLMDGMRLENLSLRGCAELGNDDIAKINMPNLRHLDLRGNSVLSDAALECLKSMPNLEHLDLGYCYDGRITDTTMESVAELKQLKHLGLEHVPFTDDGLKHVGKLRYLEDLSLSFATEYTDDGLDHLKELPLKRLAIDSSFITNDAVAHFRDLKHLESLSLRNCRNIDDRALAHLLNSPLRYLDLTGCSGITNLGLADWRAANTYKPKVMRS